MRVLGAPVVVHVVSIFTSSLLYLTSAAFHAFSTQRAPAAYLLLADRAFVFLNMAVMSVANRLVAALLDPRATASVRVAVDGLQLSRHVCHVSHLDVRAFLDPLLLCGLSLLVLIIYRLSYSTDRTWRWVGHDHYGDAFDTLRRGHVDLQFGEAIAMLFAVGLLQEVLAAAYELSHMAPPYGALMLGVMGAGILLMIPAGVNDRIEFTDARFARRASMTIVQGDVPGRFLCTRGEVDAALARRAFFVWKIQAVTLLLRHHARASRMAAFAPPGVW